MCHNYDITSIEKKFKYTDKHHGGVLSGGGIFLGIEFIALLSHTKQLPSILVVSNTSLECVSISSGSSKSGSNDAGELCPDVREEVFVNGRNDMELICEL